MTDNESSNAYWKENIKLIIQLMSVWFVVSFGFGIILLDVLNTIRIGGYQLGFWFAQQGSIYVFVILIYVYTRKMAKLEKKYNVAE